MKNPKQEELWLAAVRMERQAGNDRVAEATLAKALQVGPATHVIGFGMGCMGRSCENVVVLVRMVPRHVGLLSVVALYH